MNLTELYSVIKVLAEDDQSLPDARISVWIDLAIDRINIALKCKVPKIAGKPLNYVPEFDERYHEALVMYALSKYHESDSAYSNAQYFVNQFEGMLMIMQRDMEIKPSIRADYNVQQITVTSISEYAYPLSMPTGSYYDHVTVFLNDVETKSFSIDTLRRRIRLNASLVLKVGDKITVVFENNSDLNNPPYQWWTF